MPPAPTHGPPAHLIFTLDYELFGNGLGQLDTCLLAPVERMLGTFERAGASLTIFVEATEFARMDELGPACGVDVAPVKAQLRDAFARGHDVQLHVHPQWRRAERQADGTWRVDYAKWRTGDLPPDETRTVIGEGKAWLEDLLRDAGRTYRCTIFRAGGWCIQPAAHVLAVLRDLGFVADSTVAPGMRDASAGYWYDFRAAPRAPWWRVTGDVCTAADEGLIEIPIAAADVPLATHAATLARRKLAADAGFPPGCTAHYRVPTTEGGLTRRARKVAALGRAMCDFSGLGCAAGRAVIDRWRAERAGGAAPLPIVAIGHNKNFSPWSERELDALLAWAADDPGLHFSTYGQWLEAAGVAA